MKAIVCFWILTFFTLQPFAYLKLFLLYRFVASRITFTETNDKQLEICDGGSEVVCSNSVPYQSYEAWTNAELNAHCYYWEVTFSIRSLPESGCGCAAGVVHPGSGLRDNPGRSSWYIGISYTREGVSYYSCDSRNTVTEDFRHSQMRLGPRRLGLYLDCSGKTLTVLDPGDDQTVCTLREVDVSRPLVPAVRFCTTCPTPRCMSARITSSDIKKIPALVRGIRESQLLH